MLEHSEPYTPTPAEARAHLGAWVERRRAFEAENPDAARLPEAWLVTAVETMLGEEERRAEAAPLGARRARSA